MSTIIVELFHFISSQPMKTACAGATGRFCVSHPLSHSHNGHHSTRELVSSPLNLYFPFVIISTVPLSATFFATSPKVLELVASISLSDRAIVAIDH